MTEAPSVAVRAARMTAVVRATRRICQNAAKPQKSTMVRGSSGESRLKELGKIVTKARLILVRLAHAATPAFAARETELIPPYVPRTGNSEDPSNDTGRIDYLAGKLSRERVKTTTLDLIDVAAFAERHANRERSRGKELGYEV